jgi:hypothetical protein
MVIFFMVKSVFFETEDYRFPCEKQECSPVNWGAFRHFPDGVRTFLSAAVTEGFVELTGAAGLSRSAAAEGPRSDGPRTGAVIALNINNLMY